jgi:hypothetical protein
VKQKESDRKEHCAWLPLRYGLRILSGYLLFSSGLIKVMHDFGLASKAVPMNNKRK